MQQHVNVMDLRKKEEKVNSCACDKVKILIDGANQKLKRVGRTDLIPTQEHGSAFENKVRNEEITTVAQTLAEFKKTL